MFLLWFYGAAYIFQFPYNFFFSIFKEFLNIEFPYFKWTILSSQIGYY